MKLVYLPLEMYKERYTEFLSGQTGMFQRQAERLGIELYVIRPDNIIHRIKAGRVLDPAARCTWAFQQTEILVSDILSGYIEDADVIYFEDFWHPGMEMVPYTLDIAGCGAKLFAFNHAQSVDPNDFTYPMRNWIRPFENAWCNRLDGIFCADKALEDMMLRDWSSAKPKSLHATGTVFDHYVLYDIAGIDQCPSKSEKTNHVVYSSRWDTEKNPGFFMDLVEAVLNERDDISFDVCSGSFTFRSNDYKLVDRAKALRDKHKYNFAIHTDLTKEEYYQFLYDAKVQFNCADQDFVSYTLLEATAFGCAPLYPNYLTFPSALQTAQDHLYKKGDLASAKGKLYNLINNFKTTDYSWVYQKYEGSVQRMLRIMGFNV